MPTPLQQAILDLLTEYEYLTTHQIWEYLPNTTGEQARRNVLARLEQRGWVRAACLYPERGHASERYWTLTPAGAAVLGIHYTAPQLTQLAEIRRVLAPQAPEPVGIGSNQARVLRLLADWKQLTTKQIWQHLDPDKPYAYTKKLLLGLQARGMVRGADLHPECGTRSEHYWWLLEQGARAIGVRYGKQYRQRPALAAIEYRGLQLALLAAIDQAGWRVIRPTTAQERPMPQEQQLRAAVLARERQALDELLVQGADPQSLQARRDRVEQGMVGAVVPPVMPDYVAYIADRPELAVVLIPHPPYATRAFWSHRRERIGTHVPTVRLSRGVLYSRLAEVVPVIAVFATPESGQQYMPLLKRSGFHELVVTHVTKWLRSYAVNGRPPTPL